MTTLTINEAAIPKMLEYVAKINVRAKKIGQAILDVIEIGRTLVPAKDDNGREIKGAFNVDVTFEVFGETPKINGWEFIARIEHDQDIGNILRVAPGKTLPNEFWNADCNCDHCGTKRIRKDTFILRNAAGEYKQIGRQCVRDFIGYDNPADMYWWVGIVQTLCDESASWGGIRSETMYDVATVIARAMAATKILGYVSRRMVDDGFQGETTSSVVAGTFSVQKDRPEIEKQIMISAANFSDDTKKVIDWIKGWDEDTVKKSEFNHNVHNMVSKDICRWKDFGLMACLPTMYLKHLDLLEERKVRSNLHVGEVKQKVELSVTIKNIIYLNGYYGTTTLIMMEDDAGNCFKWAASNPDDVKRGDVVVIKGTIKAHEEYNGRNQTCLTRCKIESANA